MLGPRGHLLLAAWACGLAGGVAFVPWNLGIGVQLTQFGAPPPHHLAWAASAWTIALVLGAGWWVGSRDRAGLRRGFSVGALGAGLAWALGAFPGLAVEGQWAVWLQIPKREYGDAILATALADAVPRTALYVVGTAWIAAAIGGIAGTLGAAIRPATEREEPSPPFFAPVVVAVTAVGAAWLGFTLSAQLLPGLERSTTEPLFEVARFVLVAQGLLAGLAAALVGYSSLSIWRRASPRWKVAAGMISSLATLLLVAPWATTITAPDYAWIRQWYLYVAGAPIGLVVGLALGRRGGRRPPTRWDWAHEVGWLATLSPWLLLGPCGLGAGLALARGIGPIVPFILDAQGSPDPAAFTTTLLYAGLATIPWSLVGATALGVIVGGPLYLLLAESS